MILVQGFGCLELCHNGLRELALQHQDLNHQSAVSGGLSTNQLDCSTLSPCLCISGLQWFSLPPV